MNNEPPKILKWELIAMNSPLELNEMIEGKIHDGWQPIGNPFYVPPSTVKDCESFCQAVVLYDSK